MLLKIKNQKLSLLGYHLNANLGRGLYCALNQFPFMLREIKLIGNDLSDDAFSIILKGLLNQDSIKVIYYKRNQFGKKSVEMLLPILEKKGLLTECHIVECKTIKSTCRDILVKLKDYDHLNKLSLVRAEMNADAIPHLCEYVSNSHRLHCLDISWNDLHSKSIGKICDALQENRNLKYLNMGWNSMINPMANKICQSNVSEALKHKVVMAKLHTATKLAWRREFRATKNQSVRPSLSLPKHMPGPHLAFVKNLIQFIKQNKKLVHLDLSFMGMDEETLLMFGVALRRAKSLLSLHLSGNPGNSFQVQEEICNRIHAKPYDPTFTLE